MTALTVSLHFLDRLAQRFGIVPAEPEAVTAALMQSPAIQAALKLGGTGLVYLPQIGACLVVSNGVVVTVYLDQSPQERGITPRCVRARGRRPVLVEGGEDG